MLKSIGVLAFLFYNIDVTEMWWDAFLSSLSHSAGGEAEMNIKLAKAFKKAIIMLIIACLLLMFVG